MNKLIIISISLFLLIACMNSGKQSKSISTDVVELPEGMKLIKVEGGSFTMGQNDPDLGCKGCSDDESPAHTVTLQSFLLSETEVTNAQYAAFLQAKKPSQTEAEKWINIGAKYCKIIPSYEVKSDFEGHPVVGVSWYGAKAFCEYYGGRLATEAEWEYAAKGGNKSKGYNYSGSNTLSEVAWYRDNSNKKPNQVGLKKSNELGFKDMSGNVYEWCSDWGHENYKDAPSDGRSWEGENGGHEDRRFLRGGSWGYIPYYCRVTDRYWVNPQNQTYDIGFRFSKTD